MEGIAATHPFLISIVECVVDDTACQSPSLVGAGVHSSCSWLADVHVYHFFPCNSCGVPIHDVSLSLDELMHGSHPFSGGAAVRGGFPIVHRGSALEA